MKLAYYPYELKGPKLPAKGALLKFEFEDNTVGYANCHPWASQGDLPLDQQLSKLQQNETTRITERCLYFARLDAMGRFQKESLFNHLVIPRSNWSIINPLATQEQEIKQAISNGFTTFKVKMGNDLEKEFAFLQLLTQWLAPIDYKLRLDFNAKMTEKDFLAIQKKLDPYKNHLDYIEDPFPFNIERWSITQKKYGITLACDFNSHLALGLPEAARILVIKPAIQDEAIFLESVDPQQKLVITSYLDHPLGQLSAAYAAALCYEKKPDQIAECGFVTQSVYEPNDFSKLLSISDARLNPPQGTGFGFDQLLISLPWRQI